MTKNAKFLSILILISVAILGFLLLTSKLQKIDKLEQGLNNSDQKQQAKVDMQQVRSDYQREAKKIIGEYDQFLNELQNASSSPSLETGSSTAKTTDLKERLLALTVPGEFKDMHLNLILSLSNIEKYLVAGSKTDQTAGEELFKQAKASNSWLNN